MFDITHWVVRLGLVGFALGRIAVGEPLHSAARFAGESYEDATRRYEERLRDAGIGGGVDPEVTAESGAVTTNQLLDHYVPVYVDYAQVLHAFHSLRNVRWLVQIGMPAYQRRSTWLFPDDGCYARAALAVNNLTAWHYPTPAKVFIFGTLTAATLNHPGGKVSWRYHVAPIVKLKHPDGKFSYYVLDPALNFDAPLVYGAWLRRMTQDLASIKVNICHSRAYAPTSPCASPSPTDSGNAVRDQVSLLPNEWNRLVELHRNPQAELIGQ